MELTCVSDVCVPDMCEVAWHSDVYYLLGLFCSVCKSLCSGVELFHSLCLTLTGGVGGVCVGNLKGYSKQKIK